MLLQPLMPENALMELELTLLEMVAGGTIATHRDAVVMTPPHSLPMNNAALAEEEALDHLLLALAGDINAQLRVDTVNALP